MRFTLALLLTLGLVSCAALDSSVDDQKAGAAIGRADRGPALGSVPPGGGAVDAYLDRHEAVLRRELKGTGVQVRREERSLCLVMPGNIVFATNSADIRSDFFAVLNSVAKALAEFHRTSIRVTGHTDSTGGDKINQPLSERRADSVAMYLRSQKIAATRIASYGYGSRYPVASNDSAAGREQNRRVELELVPEE